MIKPIKEKLIRFLIITIGFIIPLTLLIGVLIIFQKTKPALKIFPKEKVEEKYLSPSEVLNNKTKYNKQKITIQGKIRLEPAVCEMKKCLPEEPCCGCPQTRNISLYDVESFLASKSSGRLRLLGIEGKGFCSRLAKSCRYDCGDWQDNAIYEVKGRFFSEPPPPGWQMSLDYYFQVEDKSLIRRISINESIASIVREITAFFKGLTGSGYYVLP